MQNLTIAEQKEQIEKLNQELFRLVHTFNDRTGLMMWGVDITYRTVPTNKGADTHLLSVKASIKNPFE